MIYINQSTFGQQNTIAEFTKSEEAKDAIKEIRKSNTGSHYYITSTPTYYWELIKEMRTRR